MTKPLLFFGDFGGMLGHAYYALNIRGLLYDKVLNSVTCFLKGWEDTTVISKTQLHRLFPTEASVFLVHVIKCSVGICYFRRGHVLRQGGNCVTQQNYWWLSHSIILIEVVPTGTMSSPLIRIHPTRDVVCLFNISYKCFFLLYVVFNLQHVIVKDYPFLLWIGKAVTLFVVELFWKPDILVPLPSLSFLQNLK